jgi:hypothetical protein
MSHSLLPSAVALVLILSGAAAWMLPSGRQQVQAPPGKARIQEPATPPAATVQQSLSDARPSAGLATEELQQRIDAARALIWSNDITPAQRAKLRGQIESDRGESRRRLVEDEVRARQAHSPATGGPRPQQLQVPANAAASAPAAIVAKERRSAKDRRDASDRQAAPPCAPGRGTAPDEPLWQMPDGPLPAGAAQSQEYINR